MKILHVAQSLKGGSATYFNEMLPDHIHAFGGSNVGLVVPATDAEYLRREIGQCRQFWFKSRGRSIPLLLNFVMTVASACWRFKPDVLHLHGIYAGTAGRLVAPILSPKTKIVYCAHGWALERETSWLVKKLTLLVEKSLAPTTDVIVNISHADANCAAAAGIAARENVVVYNGVEDVSPPGQAMRRALARERGLSPDKINVVFAGRLDHQKGHEIAEGAFRDLPADKYHLYVLGDSVLSAHAEPQELPVNVTRLGWQSRAEVCRYMQVADVLIMPSKWEGFGLTAIEAMRAGTAVLCSKVGGLPEVVDHDVTGIVVDTNEPGSYRDVLLRMSKDEWHSLGAAGRRRFESLFTSALFTARLREVYRRFDATSPRLETGSISAQRPAAVRSGS